MAKYTHQFIEQGNGYPSVGDEVLVEGDMGWHEIKVVAEISPIHTRQYQPNYVYLTLEAADRDYDDLSDAETDKAWSDLHHVAEISGE